MSESETRQQAAASHPRLPCRGCTTDCNNYAVCEGTPWRIDRDGKVATGQARTGRN